jgi:uncharacterized protein (DUF885 family)
MTQATLDQVNEQHLAGLVRLAPDVGTSLGLADGDDRWGNPSEEGRAEVLAHLVAWKAALEALPTEGLTPEQQLDRRVFSQHLDLVQFTHATLASRRHDPDLLTPVSWTLLRQTQNTHLAPEQRFLGLAARLRTLGSHLEAGRAVVTQPDGVWSTIAREVAAQAPRMITAVAAEAQGAEVSDALKGELAACAASALEAVAAHQAWLRDLQPTGTHWVTGPERFSTLCRLRGLPHDLHELSTRGARYVKEYRAERARWAHRLAPGRPMAEGLALLTSDLPASFGEGLARVRAACAAARQFVSDHGLCLLPPGEVLDVLETPAPLRPLVPFAALMQAPRFAPQQRSIYLVTPPEEGAGLETFAGPDVENTAIHEGFPGHHVQQVIANTSTGLLRDGVPLGHYADVSACWATDTVEGWAHYCEEMMCEEGFGGGAAARLQIAKDALWRAHRVVLDVALSTGSMTPEAAAAVLVDDLGMTPGQARAEVHRYTRMPGYAMCYLLGKETLFGLRARAKVLWRGSYSTRRFHDLVLSTGNVPLSILAQRLESTTEPSPAAG